MNDELEHVVTAELDAVGFDLVELRKGGTRSRPVLEVRIDRRDGEKVTVDDCARASRALEARLDGGTLVSDSTCFRCRRPASVPCGRRPNGGGSSAAGRACSRPNTAAGSRARSSSVDEEARRQRSRCDRSAVRRSAIPLAAVKEARLAFRIS